MIDNFWSQEIYGQIYFKKPSDLIWEDLEHVGDIEHEGILYNIYYSEDYGRYYAYLA